MEKPITLIIRETKNEIISAINNSGLPMFILDNMFKDFYMEIHELSLQQEKKEESDYEKYMSEKELNNNCDVENN